MKIITHKRPITSKNSNVFNQDKDEWIEKKYNRLAGARAYLCGAMDRANDGGIGWRNALKPFLKNLGIHVIDPCDKPIDIGLENIEERSYREQLKKEKKFAQLSKDMKLIRITDLRLSDISDFLIVHLDTQIHACGTYEEISWANRQKKPILIMIEDGLEAMPDWMFGMLPYQHFFESWNDLKEYIRHIHEDAGAEKEHMKRWFFLDYDRIIGKKMTVKHICDKDELDGKINNSVHENYLRKRFKQTGSYFHL